MGIVINDEYFENFIFSDDPEKNMAIGNAYIREADLSREYNELDDKYSNWLTDSTRPGFIGESREEALSWSNRMLEIEKELASLLDGTGVTKEEYEEAKKKLY